MYQIILNMMVSLNSNIDALDEAQLFGIVFFPLLFDFLRVWRRPFDFLGVVFFLADRM